MTTAAVTQALARLGRVSGLVEGLRGTVDRRGSGGTPTEPVNPPQPPTG